ncbi:MAG: sodium:proton antiporter [Spirochaetaceae bacterium]|nr:MAG: sodium:proton antiporter [Spirochaetaceae bacterium]
MNTDSNETTELATLEQTASEELISVMTGLLYPFIAVFGIYIIYNGHDTPGGGFQGGAIMAALFLARFIVAHENDLEVHFVHNLEKFLFALLLIVPGIFVFAGLQIQFPELKIPYLIFMNFLIGMKVALGLTIVVYRFGFFEGR